MRTIVLYVMLFTSFCLNAQEKEHEIILYSDSSFTGIRLSYEHPILKQPYFDLDGSRFETESVKRFRNNHGTFVNLQNVAGGKERYAMRIRTGVISLYEEVDIHLYGGDKIDLREGDEGLTSPLLAKGEALEYYTKAEGDVQLARYRFLKLDLKDNPGSVEHLNDFRKWRTIQVATVVAGLGLMGSSLFINEEGNAQFSPLTALGILITGGAYFYEYPKQDALLNAIDSYNGKPFTSP